MNRFLVFIACLLCISCSLIAQEAAVKANAFIQLLDSAQRVKLLFPFDTEERYRFNYVPLDDRKGVSVNELSSGQREGLMSLLRSCLSSDAVTKVTEIMQLDNILKELENRKPDDHFRDPGKYFISIFGIPSDKTIWGWRFEGHHVAFHFSADKKQLVSGTPSFLGANPAIVQQGPQKNKEVLKDETDKGFLLLHALSPEERKKAVIEDTAPAEILTKADRRPSIDHPSGIRYTELEPAHQQLLLQLLGVYIHRYTTLFADKMLKEIQAAGLDKLWFTWAGNTEKTLGKAYYYRIQGPSIIIEYDNSQNNANHVHTVIRDLNNDFGGDVLLQHYRENH